MPETALAFLEWTAPVSQAVLAVILFRRQLHKSGRLPFFFACTIYSIVVIIPHRIFAHQPRVYFAIYWTSEAIYAILALLVLNEVFHRLFEPDYEDHRWFRFLLPGTALAIGLLCLPALLRHPPSGSLMRIAAAIYAFDLGVHIVEAGILLLFWLLTQLFLAPRSRYDLGILTGFGVSASVTIVADVARFYFGSSYEVWFLYGPALGYTVAVLIWLAAFLPRPAVFLPRTARPAHPAGALTNRKKDGTMERQARAI